MAGWYKSVTGWNECVTGWCECATGWYNYVADLKWRVLGWCKSVTCWVQVCDRLVSDDLDLRSLAPDGSNGGPNVEVRASKAPR